MSLQSFCSVPTGLIDGNESHCLIKSNDVKFTGYDCGGVDSSVKDIVSEEVIEECSAMGGECGVAIGVNAFVPDRFDSLYWCVYAGVHGISAYDDSTHKEFVVEKNDKYKYVDMFRTNDVLRGTLKAKSISHQHVVDTLIGKRRIDTATCIAIAIAENVDIWIEFEHTFVRHVCGGGGDRDTGILIRTKAGAPHELMSGDIKKLTDTIEITKYEIIDLTKPIRGFSAYSLSDMQDIAEKIGVDLTNDVGKKKSKKTLYAEVSTRISIDKN